MFSCMWYFGCQNVWFPLRYPHQKFALFGVKYCCRNIIYTLSIFSLSVSENILLYILLKTEELHEWRDTYLVYLYSMGKGLSGKPANFSKSPRMPTWHLSDSVVAGLNSIKSTESHTLGTFIAVHLGTYYLWYWRPPVYRITTVQWLVTK